MKRNKQYVRERTDPDGDIREDTVDRQDQLRRQAQSKPQQAIYACAHQSACFSANTTDAPTAGAILRLLAQVSVRQFDRCGLQVRS